ncbi:hypothetical protein KM043_012316 [Ampulex compressa]|nr:hypothetical protein KM043_012316 [Ampulex compressa]
MPSNFCPHREVVFLAHYVLLAVLSLLGPGASMGYSSIAIPALTSNATTIVLREDQISRFASLPDVSYAVGALASLLTMDYGRRMALIIANLICLSGWIVIMFSHGATQLFIGRILTGLSAGMSSTPCTVYLAEISSNRWRAVCTASTSLFVSVGIVLVYSLGFVMRDDWRTVAGICALMPTIAAICCCIFLPESPTWLLMQAREEEAKEALLRIRGLERETVEFREEFADMVDYSEKRNNSEPRSEQPLEAVGPRAKKERTCSILRPWRTIKLTFENFNLPEVWKPFNILVVFFLFQQFSGLPIFTAYTVEIVVLSGIVLEPFLTTVILGIVQVIGGMLNVIGGARIGRRSISITSGAGMSLSLAVLGVYMQFFKTSWPPVLPLICVIFFVASCAVGFFVLPYAMIGELYPARYVNVLGPLTTCLSSVFKFAVVQLYPAMVQYDAIGTIYFYCTVAIIATLFVIVSLPETRGRTPSQIEDEFKGLRAATRVH